MYVINGCMNYQNLFMRYGVVRTILSAFLWRLLGCLYMCFVVDSKKWSVYISMRVDKCI